MPGVNLRLFGPPSAQAPHGPEARQVGGSKPTALLVYLALEPGPHSRESLAALLWGDSTDEAARVSLRQALKQLRGVVGDAIQSDRSRVELVGPVECDVYEFREAMRQDPTTAAWFDVPRFMSDFSVRDAPIFEEWAAETRQRLLDEYEGVLRTLAREALEHSRWREAESWAERWLESDPLSEEATRTAIEASCLEGDRRAALRHFTRYRDRLARELGTAPSADILALARRVEHPEEAPAKHTKAADDEPVGPDFYASLVGREPQWARLLKAWRAVSDGRGQVVVIEGEPGVGKSRLAEEFLQWAELEGATVLRAAGYDPAMGIPYAPIAEALRGVLDAPGLAGTAPEWLAELARLVPDVRRRFASLPAPAPADGGDRWRLYEAVAQVVLTLAAERPVVIFVDDLQWCDAESCALLHFLARRIEEVPAVLLTTLTQAALSRDATSARLCRALRSQRDATVLTLEPLSENEVCAMIRELGRVVGPTGGRRLAARVHAVTDGNPFHVIELLKTLFVQDLIRVDSKTGEWYASPAMAGSDYSDIAMPQTIRDAVVERVVPLPYEQRDLLATIAVVGRDVRTDVLSHVHGISRLRAAAHADELVGRQLLVEENGRYRCAHPVIAEVVRGTLTPARRQELHRSVALSLEAIRSPEEELEVAAQIARHAERGGEQGMAHHYAMVCAEAALQRLSFEEALSWLDLAASVARGTQESDRANRQTATVLELAGWTKPPRIRRPGSPAQGIRQMDLDLRGADAGGRRRQSPNPSR